VEDAIREITRNIWLNLLGLNVVRSDKQATQPGSSQMMAGCVQITGAWQGTLILSCTGAFARLAAGRMFEVATDNTTKDQAEDALGELTNITGGNLKAVLPGPSLLSLPTVVEGCDYRLRVPGGRTVSQVYFECLNHLFAVTLLERDPELNAGIYADGLPNR
jgi:chemotaxis protein CheX